MLTTYTLLSLLDARSATSEKPMGFMHISDPLLPKLHLRESLYSITCIGTLSGSHSSEASCRSNLVKALM